MCISGADPGFQVRGGGGGAHLKKSYFFQFWGGRAPGATQLKEGIEKIMNIVFNKISVNNIVLTCNACNISIAKDRSVRYIE